jgi:hypothetical protein
MRSLDKPAEYTSKHVPQSTSGLAATYFGKKKGEEHEAKPMREKWK